MISTISVVINTLNRASALDVALQSLLWQTFKSFEVIVVNGPSADNTESILEKFSPMNIRIGRCPVPNLSVSRNIGISMACGNIVSFIDDDAMPEPEWLEQIIAGFDSPEVGGVGGMVYDHTGYTFQSKYILCDRIGDAFLDIEKNPGNYYNFPYSKKYCSTMGTNSSFLRTALLEVGGFDEEYEYYLDETDLCLRLVDAGYIIKFVDNAFVHHKFLPSAVRNERRALKHRYPVLKNKAYFCLRNATTHLSLEEIGKSIDAFFTVHKSDAQWCCANGLLPKDSIDTFDDEAQRATDRAIEAVKSPRKLGIFLHTKVPDEGKFSVFRSHELPKRERLTIAFLSQDYPPKISGGIARFTYDLATECAQQGHLVHVLTKGEGHNRVDFEEGVWVHRIVATEHPYLPGAREWAIPQHIWNYSATMLAELDRIASHRHIDIVEAPIWDCEGIAPLLSGRYRTVTSLHTTLGISLPNHLDWTSNAEFKRSFIDPMISLEKYVLQHSHGIHANSEGIVREIEGYYRFNFDKPHLAVIQHGLSDYATKTVEKLDLLENEGNGKTINILFVGRLEERKGVDVLLDVVPELCAQFANIRIILAGDDSIIHGQTTYRKLFESKHKDLAGSRVKFLGRVSEEALRGLYASCDIFVAPSRFESFGLIYLEAMIFGRPVIGCNIGGIPEVVADGVNGILVPPGDSPALKSALISLIKDPALRRRMGRESRIRYERGFSAGRMAVDCIRFFKSFALR